MSGNTIMDTITIASVFAILGFGVFLSFKILNITDLTVEASFGFGAAITAMICSNSIVDFGGAQNIKPFIGLICAFLGGSFSGLVTAVLHTKLKINSVLSGILTLTAFYTINIIVTKHNGMLNSSIGLSGEKGVTLFSIFNATNVSKMFIMLFIVILVGALLSLFFKTKLGLSIRACGDNEQMTKTQCISTDLMKIIGLMLSNGLVALAGSLFVMQQSSYFAKSETGMMVVGVATIIIGEIVVLRSHNLNIMLVGIFIGSVVYRFIYAIALRIEFIDTNYLYLITSSLIVLVMFISKFTSDFKHNRKKKEAALKLNEKEESSND